MRLGYSSCKGASVLCLIRLRLVDFDGTNLRESIGAYSLKFAFCKLPTPGYVTILSAGMLVLTEILRKRLLSKLRFSERSS